MRVSETNKQKEKTTKKNLEVPAVHQLATLSRGTRFSFLPYKTVSHAPYTLRLLTPPLPALRGLVTLWLTVTRNGVAAPAGPRPQCTGPPSDTRIAKLASVGWPGLRSHPRPSQRGWCHHGRHRCPRAGPWAQQGNGRGQQQGPRSQSPTARAWAAAPQNFQQLVTLPGPQFPLSTVTGQG